MKFLSLKSIVLISLLVVFSAPLLAADAAKDERDGAALLPEFYRAVDAGELETLGKTDAMREVLSEKPFTSATLMSLDSSVLLPALIAGLRENNLKITQHAQKVAAFDAAIANLRATLIAPGKPDLTASSCGADCPRKPH
ncbi:MAG: hypothetical protein K2W94_02865 [Alphaproteobacteria bacterium]|nr:hypothetical protein [Alphaproteobacteria bacterium]